MRAIERGLDDWMEDDFFGNSFFENDDFFTQGRAITAPKDGIDELLEEIQKKHKSSKSEAKKEVVEDKGNQEEKKQKDKKQNEIEQLKAKLQEYIKKEEYEKAAVVRDQIKKLEK